MTKVPDLLQVLMYNFMSARGAAWWRQFLTMPTLRELEVISFEINWERARRAKKEEHG